MGEIKEDIGPIIIVLEFPLGTTEVDGKLVDNREGAVRFLQGIKEKVNRGETIYAGIPEGWKLIVHNAEPTIRQVDTTHYSRITLCHFEQKVMGEWVKIPVVQRMIKECLKCYKEVEEDYQETCEPYLCEECKNKSTDS